MADLSEGALRMARVLVVEDDPITLALIRSILQSIGIRKITTAHDGHAAWAKYEDGGIFDLVVSDWNMPVMNGLEVLKNIRASHSATPFIMVTARDTEESIRRATDYGVTGYVLKPFAAEDLTAEVRRVLLESHVLEDSSDPDFFEI